MSVCVCVYGVCACVCARVCVCMVYVRVCVCVCVCSQYNIVVEDIMVTEVKFVSSQSSFREVKLLLDSSSLNSIPLVDSKGTAARRGTRRHDAAWCGDNSSSSSSRLYDPAGQHRPAGAAGAL